MTLQEQIEASFGDGPEAPPVALTLAAGHRALRRRRIGATVAAAAVLAVVGTGVTVAATGEGARPQGRDVPVATDGPTPSASTPTDGGPGNAALFGSGNLAAYDVEGNLRLSPGATIVRQVPDPLGLQPEGSSVGLVVEKDGERQWLLLHHTTDATGDTTGAAFDPDTKGTFDEWLAEQVSMASTSASSSGGVPDLVEFGAGEQLVALPGAEILAQQASPPLPADFARPDDLSAVAKVRWQGDVWFVLARDLGAGPAQMISTRAAGADHATTIEQFLDWARPAYANAVSGSSEGLR
jgi:hypothetical protein